MRRILCLIFLFFFFLVPTFSHSSVESKVIKLDNGLTVIVNEMPSSPVAAIYAWVKTGSANEGPYLASGITHFVEHMIFRGTATRGPGVIPDEAKSLGGSINAATSYDYTVFTLNLPKENFAKGADLLADMMQNANFSPKDVEFERDIILKEMHMVNDRPERKLSDLLQAEVYRFHPYRFPIIGQEEIFKNVSPKDLSDYYQEYYAPGNIILSVAGSFTADEILPVIKETFGKAPARSAPLRQLPEEPEQISARTYEQSYSTDLVRMDIAWQGVPLLHSDLFALDVLAMAMGDGESSRLYQRLYREKKLVVSVGATNSTPIDRGYFGIGVMMARDNREAVIGEIEDVIREIKQKGLRPDELKKIKRQVEVDNIRSRETAGGMAYRTALELAFTGDHLFSDTYLEGVARVTNEDIRRVASQYLVDRRRTVVSLLPKIEKKTAAAAPSQGETPTIRETLPNGLTLLLKEEKTLPVVTMNVALASGIRQEPDNLEGLAVLTGRVWDKSVKGSSPEKLSQEIESRGGMVSSASGRNSLTLNLQFLKDDLGLALDYLEKFIRTPDFQPSVIEQEKSQMMSAIAARKDSVIQNGLKTLSETLFLRHPFREDGLGTEESLARIRPADVSGFYSRFAVPKNMVVSVFGDIDAKAMSAELRRRLGAIPAAFVELATFEEDLPSAARHSQIGMDKEQSAVLYGFQAPDMYAPEHAAMEVVANLLGSPLNGRLFKSVREELGKAYALGASYTPGIDAGMMVMYVLTTSENVDRVRSIVEAELQKLAAEPVSDKELRDAKIYLKGEHARDLETVAARAATSTVNELLGLGYDYEKTFDQRIDAVTPQMVQKAAQTWLKLNQSAVVVVKGQ